MDDSIALVRAAQAGDEHAFGTLVEVHYDSIFRFAFRWCGNRADAEDIAQLACIKLARVLGQYRHEAAFSTWLYRLVINCAKDWQRTQMRHQSDTGDNIEEAVSAGADAETNIYLAQLLALLDKLPDGWKDAVLLVHAEGMTHAEAGRCLEVTESTISWRIHQTRKQLTGFIQQEGQIL